MKTRFLGAAWAVLFVLGAACAPDASVPLASLDEGASLPGVRNDALRRAAERHGVPRQLLVAHAWNLGRLEIAAPAEAAEAHAGEEEAGHHGHPHIARHGLMRLTDADVEQASAQLGFAPEDVRSQPFANAEAAAALLRAHALALAPAGEPDWAAFVDASARLAGLPAGTLREGYSEEMSRLLSDGLDVTLSDGERVTFASVTDLPAAPEGTLRSRTDRLSAPGEYPAMSFVAAHPNNYVPGRGGGTIQYVILHMTVISYWDTLSLFSKANSAYSSTQYVIRSSDGEITQMVNETDGAWHAGNMHYSMNSIGIEHEGMMPDPSVWFTEAMYQSSARLVCAIAKRYDIPVDRKHIIGHYQVPDGLEQNPANPPGSEEDIAANPRLWGGATNNQDPSYGGKWNWDYYLKLVDDCVKASAPAAAPLRGYVHTTGAVEFRQGAGDAHALIETLTPDEKVFVEAGPVEGAWYQVLDRGGRRGFVKGASLTPVQAKLVHSLPTTESVVALTFEAGADRGNAESILDTLSARGVKATFALTGAWAEANRDLVARMHADGHQLVHQGDTGRSFTGVSSSSAPLTYEQRVASLWRGHVALHKGAGISGKPFFRPPFGDTDPSVLTDAYSRGYDYVLRWTMESLGTRGGTAAEIVRRAQDYLAPGAVYRFDMGGQTQDAAALPEIIRSLSALGYRFVRVADYIPERPSPAVSSVREDGSGRIFAVIDGVERRIATSGKQPVLIANRAVAFLLDVPIGTPQAVQVYDTRSGQVTRFPFNVDLANRLLLHPTTDGRYALIAEGTVGEYETPVLTVFHSELGPVQEMISASFSSLYGDIMTVQRWERGDGQTELTPGGLERFDLRELLGT